MQVFAARTAAIMKSRKQALKSMISLVGNAAAHLALYPGNAFAIKEAVLYEMQAEDLAQARRWNDQEIETFLKKSKRDAANVIRTRAIDYRGRKFDNLLAVAETEIDKFIEKELRK